MDIHKPKPWHGLREFLKEYGIIVLGVLTALAFEQAAELLHWRHEVSETRKALDAELSQDLFAFKVEYGQLNCLNRRLAQLDQWVALKREGRFTPLKSAIVQPSLFNLHFAIWDGATGEARAHIPLEARLNYARLYDVLKAHKFYGDKDEEAWDELGDFPFDASTDRTELRAIQGAVRGLRNRAEELPAYRTYIDELANDLHLRADSGLSRADERVIAAGQHTLCAPLL